MIIYKATNKNNGKTYIGKTTKALEKRKKQHIMESKERKFHFHKAIQKWGENSFDWEVLFTAQDQKELNEKEIFFIKQYDTYKNGYNQTKGGEGQLGWVPSEETRKLWSEQRKGRKRSPESIRKQSEAMKGRKPWNTGLSLTEEHKRKMSKAMKGTRLGEKNPMYGKKHSEERKKKISEKLKGRVPWNKGKEMGPPSKEHTNKIQEARRKSGFVKVIQVFLENGELHAEYNSQDACKKELKIDHKTIKKYIDTEIVYKGFILRTKEI